MQGRDSGKDFVCIVEASKRNNPLLSQTPGAFVIAENAVRVGDFSAEFAFSEKVATHLNPKYETNYVSLKEGATLKSDWTSKTNLKMTAIEA